MELRRWLPTCARPNLVVRDAVDEDRVWDGLAVFGALRPVVAERVRKEAAGRREARRGDRVPPGRVALERVGAARRGGCSSES